jgi:hypothetical protein
MTSIVDAAGTTKYKYKPGGLAETEDGPWASDTVTNLYNNARLGSGLVVIKRVGSGLWTLDFWFGRGTQRW